MFPRRSPSSSDYAQQSTGTGEDYLRQEEQHVGRSIILQMEQSTNNLNDLTFLFTKQYYQIMPKDKNLVFSPLSIQLLLGLIASGCKGSVQHHLISFLKQDSVDALNHLFSYFLTNIFFTSSSINASGVSLNFVNGIWVDQSFNLKHSFQKVVHHVYNVDISQVDFKNKPEEARNKVNLWAEKETRGLIQEILPPGSLDSKTTRVVFGNALYFKGAWETKFDASMTKKHNFYLLEDGGSVDIPFMTSQGKQLIGVYDGFKVLQLEYGLGDDKRKFSMCIFLPDAKDGLSLLINKLGTEPGFVNRHLPFKQVSVGEFLVPKFKISFGFEASDFLKGMGLVLPCMTEVVEDDKLDVNKIYQKTFIEVNEDGTEAASVVTADYCWGSELPLVVDFVADHPFVFLIREDKTGVVMFIGTMLNPCVS